MLTKHLSPKKNNQYIYTEADLGEGLLDEGVRVRNVNNTKGKNGNIYTANMNKNKNTTTSLFNIEEDLGFTYYC